MCSSTLTSDLKAFMAEIGITPASKGVEFKSAVDAFVQLQKLQDGRDARASEHQTEVRTLRAEIAALKALKADDPIPTRPETLDLSQPFQVYLIEGPKKVYVGRSVQGFLRRYPPAGEWWVNHTNESLARDLHWRGQRAFRVRVFQCKDLGDTVRYEQELYDLFFPNVYNAVRP